ncbi:hypothetical protein E2C01_090310 [Portunus trituberculatus]|uniref:Uncharacterized protein n=1 Tax=Portunus trituberculatus TaxID=210409 RepID=A0A5B7JRW0_PORTR|nr:hypothetical protein [Portunus trituberculatus]
MRTRRRGVVGDGEASPCNGCNEVPAGVTDGAAGNPCRGKGLVSTTPRDTSHLPTMPRTLLPSRPAAPPPPLVITVAPHNKPCHVAAPTSVGGTARSYPQWSVR